MRENRTHGSEGGEGKPFPTPIRVNQGSTVLNNHGLKAVSPEIAFSIVLLVVVPGKALLDILHI
ncbi:MAG: hypothetical protein ACQERT_15950, partial [Thermodesulfobacteriota bacterium]